MDRIVPSKVLESEWTRSLSNLFGHNRRRVWRRDNIIHIEFRDVDVDDFRTFGLDLHRELLCVEGIEDVVVNGLTGRAILRLSRDIEDDTLVQLVQDVEEEHGYGDAPFTGTEIHYPADVEPVTRKAVHLAADTVGVGLGSMLKLFGYEPSRLNFDLAAAMTMVENTPRFHQMLESKIGEESVEVGFGAINALIQAIGSGPIGPLMDLMLHVVKIRGALARRAQWTARQERLGGSTYDGVYDREAPEERPVPLPDGPIEEYSTDALHASVGGFLVGIADTKDIEASTTPLFGGLPKAARYGREAYISELVRVFGEREIVTLRPEVLECMDRVDAILVDANVLFTGELLLGEVSPCGDREEEDVRQGIARLFDASDPTADVSDDRYRLGPLKGFDAEVTEEQQRKVDRLDSSHAPVLALLDDGELAALIQTRPATDPGAEPLMNRIRRAGWQLVIATDDVAAGESLNPDGVVPHEEASDHIRRMQQEGRVVAYLGVGTDGALRTSDLGIASAGSGEPAPWKADLVTCGGIEDVAFIIDACETARKVSKQSVMLAGTGAAVGMFIGIGGLDETEPGQIMNAVNAASLTALLNGLRHALMLERLPRPPRRDDTPWHLLGIDAVLERLETSREGLTGAEAQRRRKKPEPETSKPLKMAKAMVEEMANPFTPILVAGAGLSAFVGSLADAGLVGAVIALNATIGGVERFQAEEAIDSLERRESQSVRTVRGGRSRLLDEHELVPGDVIHLEAGDVVPADCRIIDATDLEVDESSLTGESLPVEKGPSPSFSAAIAERKSMLYDGTSIAVGTTTAVVVAIGSDTEARRGVLSGRRDVPETGVESRLEEITDMTLPVAGLSGALLMGTGISRGLDVEKLVDAGVGMAVAAVPEGLPLLSTIAQLAASRRLSKRGALVRNPRAVEALGRMDVLCADKTGTLTVGEIRLHSIADGARFTRTDSAVGSWERRIASAALRASPPSPGGRELPHPTDRAVVHGCTDIGVEPTDGVDDWKRRAELPFQPDRGYHAVLADTAEGALLSVKGAPEVLLPRCSRQTLDDGERVLNDEEQRGLMARAEELAGRGLRVLVVAERRLDSKRTLVDDDVGDLSFRGFLALSDPVRDTSRQSIERLREADIDVIMITGDHPKTARRIAEDLGLTTANGVLTGAELERLSEEELDRHLADIHVIARATPAHKVRIVRALQRTGRVVGMTGDGANDASAIRLADVGIALGEDATSAARDAADLVVVDERIETIVEAIAEGRAMWHSVRDAVSILVGGNLGEIGFTLASGLAVSSPTLNARQLLLVNLLTDVAPSLSIALRPPEAEVMQNLMAAGPREMLGAALDREIIKRAVTTGSSGLVGWSIARALPGGARGASTVALLSLVGTQLAQTLMSGKPTTSTVAASVGTAAVLLGLVETPGISHFFGCRPIGPIGLGIAATTAGVSASVSAYGPLVREAFRDALIRANESLDETTEWRPPAPVYPTQTATQKPSETSASR